MATQLHQQSQQPLILQVQTAQSKAKEDIRKARACLASGQPVVLQAEGHTLQGDGSRYATLLNGSSNEGQGLLRLQGGTLDCAEHQLSIFGNVCMEEVTVLCSPGLQALFVGSRASLDLQSCTVSAAGSSQGWSKQPQEDDPVNEVEVEEGARFNALSTHFTGLARGIRLYQAQGSFKDCVFDLRGSLVESGCGVTARGNGARVRLTNCMLQASRHHQAMRGSMWLVRATSRALAVLENCTLMWNNASPHAAKQEKGTPGVRDAVALVSAAGASRLQLTRCELGAAAEATCAVLAEERSAVSMLKCMVGGRGLRIDGGSRLVASRIHLLGPDAWHSRSSSMSSSNAGASAATTEAGGAMEAAASTAGAGGEAATQEAAADPASSGAGAGCAAAAWEQKKREASEPHILECTARWARECCSLFPALYWYEHSRGIEAHGSTAKISGSSIRGFDAGVEAEASDDGTNCSLSMSGCSIHANAYGISARSTTLTLEGCGLQVGAGTHEGHALALISKAAASVKGGWLSCLSPCPIAHAAFLGEGTTLEARRTSFLRPSSRGGAVSAGKGSHIDLCHCTLLGADGAGEPTEAAPGPVCDVFTEFPPGLLSMGHSTLVGCEISGFATGVMFTEQKSARLHGCSLGGRRLGAACGWPGPGLPSIRSCYVQKPLWPDEHCFTCTDPVASAEQALGRPPVGQAVVGPEAAAAPGVDPSPACDCSTAAGAMQSPAAGAAGSAPVAGGRQGKGPTQASCGGAMSSSSGSGSKGINEEHDHGSRPAVCAACGTQHKPSTRLKLCSGCLSMHYCGPACAKQHWSQHRLQCAVLCAARAKSEAA